MSKEFVHLHVHSEYSLLDGANRIEDIVRSAKQDKQTALAITDHGNMHGALEHYNICKKYGIKPIIGCEVYIAKKSRFRKHNKTNGYNHLTLLAMNQEGYKNLLLLTSLSFVEGLSFRPRIDMELLEKHAKGILCLSGCLSGKVNEYFLNDQIGEAEKFTDRLQQIFGAGHFWLELQRNGLNIQDKATEAMVALAGRTGIPLIATNDIHYHRQEDCDFQDTILCINTRSKKADPDRFRFETNTLFFKKGLEMAHAFRDLPSALKTTMDVASMVDLDIQQGKFAFPEVEQDNPYEFLSDSCERSIDKLYPNRVGCTSNDDGTRCLCEVHSRLYEELSTIKSMGFPTYFLIVQDIVNWAKAQGIPVGPGRGSAAGSLVSYLLGITSVDPLKYGLLFERFLNEARTDTLPDIDLDFCKDQRKRVIDYIKGKYGDDKAASIITFGRFGAKASIRAICRVQGIPIGESDKIAKKVTGETIAESLAKDKSLKEDKDKHPDLFAVAQKLEGMVQYAGTHASGIVVADRPLHEIVPMGRHPKDGTIITQWDLKDCEKVGLVKFDILGLETLTIIDRTLKLIKESGQELPLPIEKINLDDKAVYKSLQHGDTEGVFQCYSDGMRKLLSEMLPTEFDHIVAAIALFRPGPLDSGIANTFIKRKNGQEKVEYLHRDLLPILGNTYGTMIYQEQIMKIAQALAGFTLNEANELRTAVGKKLPELIAKVGVQFLAGCKKQGKITKDEAQELWDQILVFGRYGFNLSHSVCYAYLTYYTAYLKAYYFKEFMAANMTQEMNDTERCRAFLRDTRRHNIKILPPSLKKPLWNFQVEPEGIRIGLGIIKGVGPGFAEELTKIKPKSTMVETLRQVPQDKLRKNVFEGMVKAGLLDEWNMNRAMLLEYTTQILALIHPKRAHRKKDELFENDQDIVGHTDFTPWTVQQMLTAEREAYGIYVSGHPFEYERHNRFGASIRPLKDLIDVQEKTWVHAAGIVTDITVKSVKTGPNRGRKYARVIFEDDEDTAVVTLFTGSYDKYIGIIEDALKNCIPLVISGKSETITGIPQIVGTKVKLLSDVLAHSNKVQIYPQQEDNLGDIHKVLSKHPGKHRVYIIHKGEGSNIVIRTQLYVNPTKELVEELTQLKR